MIKNYEFGHTCINLHMQSFQGVSTFMKAVKAQKKKITNVKATTYVEHYHIELCLVLIELSWEH